MSKSKIPHTYSPHVAMVIGCLMVEGAHRAVKYVDRNYVVRATRTWHRRNRKFDKRDNVEITLTFGRPNYLERDFIKDAVKAGEPFPVKKVQFRMPPKRRA